MHKARGDCIGLLTHKVIADAAFHEAAKAFTGYCEREGCPETHTVAQELLAAFAGAAVDKLIETKGLDFLDREKAKRLAREQINRYYDENI